MGEGKGQVLGILDGDVRRGVGRGKEVGWFGCYVIAAGREVVDEGGGKKEDVVRETEIESHIECESW